MSTIKDTDLFLVQRGTTSYKQNAKDLMSTIKDTDLMLVQRGADSYKVTCEDVKDQLGGGGSGFTSVEITPLTITPESSDQYLTCSTDIAKVNGAVPADVIWNWYQYDGSTGDAGKTLLKTLTNRESVDTLLLPAGAANKYIGCSVEYLAVTIPETARCKVGQPSGPVAVMNGLRFDKDRSTYLERRFNDAFGPFTFSCWVKPLSHASAGGWILGLDSYGIVVNSSNGLSYNNGSSGTPLSAANALPENKWTHVVVTYSGQNGGQEFKAYINGVDTGLTATHDAGRTTIRVGRNSTGNYYSGYLSDYYYVDEYVIPPTAFGKQFAEGWGPLDSSQVEANIGASGPLPPEPPEQPYDSRANTDQEWSSQSSDVNNPERAFTGNLDTDVNSNGATLGTGPSEGSFTFTYDVAEKIEIFARGFSGERAEVYIGTDYLGKIDFNASEYRWTSFNYTGQISPSNPLKFVNDKASYDFMFNGIRVDGRLLINDGVWNNSQNWSDSVTGVAGSAAPAFDGSGSEVDGETPSSTITFSPNLGSGSFDVKVVVNDTNASPNNTVTIDGTQLTAGAASSSREFTGTVSSFNAMTITGDSGKPNFKSVSVDGAILVDAGAQYNTSQVWSSGVISGAVPPDSQYFWQSAFDGNLTTRVNGGSGETYTLTLSTPISITDSTKIDVHLLLDNKWIYINGSQFNVSSFTNGGTLSLTGADISGNQITSFGCPNNSSIAGISIDGVLLVDGAPTWNTSQVWSNGGDANANAPTYGWTAAFDGDTATRVSALAGQRTECTLSVSGTKFEILGNENGAVDDSSAIEVNGTPVRVAPGQWKDVSTEAAGTLTKLSCKDANGGVYTQIYAVRVDGAVLVNQANFGTNGFYLPFDPAQQGADYSSGTLSGTAQAPWSSAFNGETETKVTTSDNAQASITFTNSIPFTSKLRIRAQENPTDTSLKVYVNDTELTGLPPGSLGWVDITSQVTSPVTKIAVQGNGGANSSAFAALEADGVLLVDHSSIGVDKSGNNNDFHDQDFSFAPEGLTGSNTTNLYNVNNTNGSTDVDLWSKTINWTGTQNSSALADDLLIELPQNVESYGTFTFTYTNPLNKGDGMGGQFRAYDANGEELTYWECLNGAAQPANHYGPPLSGTSYTYQFGKVSSPVRYVKITSYLRDYGTINGISVAAKNIVGVDTVLDTPMNNYAVLDGGKNGNLQTDNANLRSSTMSISGGKYYAETTITGDNNSVGVGDGSVNATWNQAGGVSAITITSGTAGTFDSGDVIGIATDGSDLKFYKNGVFAFKGTTANTGYFVLFGTAGLTINYGQQPFVYATDNGDGTVTLKGEAPESPYDSRANTDQVWSASVSSGDFTSADPPSNLFNNILSTADGRYRLTGGASGAEFTYTLDQTYASGTVAVKAAVATTGDAVLIVNNTEVAIKQGDANTSEWVEVSATSFNSLTVKRVSGSSDIQLFGVKVNGRLLVDQGVFNNSQNWSGSTSGSASGSGFEWSNAFNGILATPGASGAGTGTPSYFANFETAVTGLSSLTVYVAPGQSLEDNASIVLADGTVVPIVLGDVVASGSSANFSYASLNTSKFGSIKGIGVNQTIQILGMDYNGVLLVDAGAQYNTSQIWSDAATASPPGSNTSVANVFDGDDSTYYIAGENPGTITLVDPSFANQTVEILSANGDNKDRWFDVNSQGQIQIPASKGFNTYGTATANGTVSIQMTGSGGWTAKMYKLRIGGKVLVNGVDKTPKSKLYQTWSQWNAVLVRARLFESEEHVSQLERVIIDQAVPMQRGSKYAAGSIVDIAGELYEALVDGADVSAADFVARLFREGSDEWLKLGITTRQRPSFSVPTPTPEPTPEPTPQPPVIDGGTNSVVIDGGSFDQGLFS